MRPSIFVNVSVWVLVSSLLAAAPAGGELIERIVATVDGEPITLSDLRQYSREWMAQLASVGSVMSDEAILDRLVTERMVAKEIEDNGILVRDEEIDAYISRIRKVNRISQSQMREALEQQGLTWERYREQVRSEIQKMQLVNREIHGRVNVTPEDVERFYEAHKEEYKLPARVKLRHIVLLLAPDASEAAAGIVREKMVKIRERIVDDHEAFEDVAKEVSEDAAASSGGDLGEVEPSKVLPEFEGPLATLGEGEVSEPIRTQAGIHLLRIDERIELGHTSLEELSEGIREQLYTEALDQRYRRWLLEDLKKRHFVEMHL